MVNVLPGSQVPLIVGVVSFVRSPLVGLARVGILGVAVSIVRGSDAAGLVLPVGSVISTPYPYVPSERAGENV
jgi:hypothetical protein